jgi:secondary thiamine-phosphate synthase enzyme
MLHNHLLTFKTQGPISVRNITTDVQRFVQNAGIRQGQILIFSRHTTTAIAVNEDEERLLEDLSTYLTKLAPPTDTYRHNDLDQRPNIPEDEPKNAHAHLMAITIGNSQTIPIIDGALALGTYQSILLVELDGPRSRSVLLQAIGMHLV